MRTRIKICGITDPAQAEVIAHEGADAIGLVFAKSSRQVNSHQAREIISVLPPFVQSVGVVVNPDPDELTQLIDLCGLDIVQLHGDESPDFCALFKNRAIKALRIRSSSDLENIKRYEAHVRGFLLDAWSSSAMGGTGMTFDWTLAEKALAITNKPVILAGGLDPDNVSRAIKQVRPWGVDVSSGVEDSPGKKNLVRVRKFIKAVRSEDESSSQNETN